MSTFAPMQLRKLKVLISWFFLAVLALGMADFSLHALTHKHAQAPESDHLVCTHDIEIQAETSTIFSAEQECLRCGQFLVHTAWAVADLGAAPLLEACKSHPKFSYYHLISNKLATVSLRGPPEA